MRIHANRYTFLQAIRRLRWHNVFRTLSVRAIASSEPLVSRALCILLTCTISVLGALLVAAAKNEVRDVRLTVQHTVNDGLLRHENRRNPRSMAVGDTIAVDHDTNRA